MTTASENPVPDNEFVGWKYAPLSTCCSFWTWLYASWRLRRRWEGPSVLVYEVGSRYFGWEHVWEERLTGDDD